MRHTALVLALALPHVGQARELEVDAWLSVPFDAVEFGESVSGAGDVNGDGFDDVIVGAPHYDVTVNEGAAFVFHGSPSGLSTVPDWEAIGPLTNDGLGNSVADAGDVNGDGFDDVIVGEPSYDGDQGVDEGAAFVFYGSPTGLESTAAWQGEGNQAIALFGSAVASAGDVNADGFDDIVVGAESYDGLELHSGAAFLYLGSASGPSLSPVWQFDPEDSGASFGGDQSVGSAGDVNGDGFDDVIVGAEGFGVDGKAWIFLGSAAGLEATAHWEAESPTRTNFGTSVSTAGDVNGDGFDDVVIGAPSGESAADDDVGGVLVYLGGCDGVDPKPAWKAAVHERGGTFGSRFGFSVSSAGDWNGDGFSDIVVGAWSFTHNVPEEGAAFLFLGSAAGMQLHPRGSATSNQEEGRFGFSVSGAGDVNGDGRDDVLVGGDSLTGPTEVIEGGGAVGVIYGR